MRRPLAAVAGAAGIVFLAVGSRCDSSKQPPPAPPSAGSLTLKGRLTDEGVECPAFRDEHGVLYTLVGSLDEFRRGDAVCIRGRRVEISSCMQGITIAVESIAAATECP